MTVYDVNIERDEKWWAISVPQLPGVFSQARTRGDVEEMARDVIALYLDVPNESFNLRIHEVATPPASVSH